MSESVFKTPDGEVGCDETLQMGCLMDRDGLLRFVPEFVFGVTLPGDGQLHEDFKALVASKRRNLLSKFHPDRQGGDRTLFK